MKFDLDLFVQIQAGDLLLTNEGEKLMFFTNKDEEAYPYGLCNLETGTIIGFFDKMTCERIKTNFGILIENVIKGDELFLSRR